MALKLEVGGIYLNEIGDEVKIISSIKKNNGETLYLSEDDIFYYEGGGYNTDWLSGGHIVGPKNENTLIKIANIEAKKILTDPRVITPVAFEALREWGEKIFGPVEPKRIVERSNEEMIELIAEVDLNNSWTDKALEEAADIVVILTRAPGLWEAVVRKMNINFDRQWNLKGDGTGYHIPKDSKG